MGAKKKVEETKKIILGRASNTLKMGLVGLPNVGKSTTFNVLSKLSVPAENYPFCTIDPTTAKIFVPDSADFASHVPGGNRLPSAVSPETPLDAPRLNSDAGNQP